MWGVCLYVAQGYPSLLLQKWLEENIQVHWEKRLFVADINQSAGDSEVLVLKSVYNTAWNYFSAKELGDTILGTWHKLFEKFELGLSDPRDLPLNLWTSPDHRDKDVHLVPVSRTVSATVLGVPAVSLDIRKLNILNQRMISVLATSSTLHLYGKKTVITHQEDGAIEEIQSLTPPGTEHPAVLVDRPLSLGCCWSTWICSPNVELLPRFSSYRINVWKIAVRMDAGLEVRKRTSIGHMCLQTHIGNDGMNSAQFLNALFHSVKWIKFDVWKWSMECCLDRVNCICVAFVRCSVESNKDAETHASDLVLHLIWGIQQVGWANNQ